MLAGFTDYSHQSLSDIISDLGIWSKNIKDSIEKTNALISEIKSNNYWSNVPNNFKNYIIYCQKFYNTALSEIDDIFPELTAVRKDHVKRLYRISKVAHDIYVDMGRLWHQDYPDKYIDYGNTNFLKVERIYAEVRDMAGDLLDLGNVASRLNDYVGKIEIKTEKHGSLNDIIEVKPNFIGIGINFNNLLRKIFPPKK